MIIITNVLAVDKVLALRLQRDVIGVAAHVKRAHGIALLAVACEFVVGASGTPRPTGADYSILVIMIRLL